MLAYAARAPRHAERRSSPNAMLAIIAVHVGLFAAVMSAKMDLPQRIKHAPTDIFFVPTPPNPPERRAVQRREPQQPRQSTLIQPPQQLPLPPTGQQLADATQPLPDLGDLTGPAHDPRPAVDRVPVAAPSAARLLTPASELKPPYPQSKLLADEEGVLKLRLTINERGRVVAVDPIGRADPVFLDAARRHLIAHWRYQPASDGARPVASSMVITLRFRLDR